MPYEEWHICVKMHIYLLKKLVVCVWHQLRLVMCSNLQMFLYSVKVSISLVVVLLVSCYYGLFWELWRYEAVRSQQYE